METMQLILDSNRGIYIPQKFAENFCMTAWHINDDDRDVLLAGPDNEFYWEVWEDVLNYAYTEQFGERWTLYQDDDLFVVSGSHVWDEESA